MLTQSQRILIDAREFVPGRFTGIGRVLTGLTEALLESNLNACIHLAMPPNGVLPSVITDAYNLGVIRLPRSFIGSEVALTKLARKHCALFISPYPKLPLFGCYCPCVNMVHDVLYLTHEAYDSRKRYPIDKWRLAMALRRSDLTWFDSTYSRNETLELIGFIGQNPKVRYPGVERRFIPEKLHDELEILDKYHLSPGYVLSMGNGLPHKNLGILLRIADRIKRRIVFIGVNEARQAFWTQRFPVAKAEWINYLPDEDMAPIIRQAFCVAQPSTAEGYGYPPLEAMACGTPAIVSKIPVLMETTGGNALTASPKDSGAWIQAIAMLEDQSFYSQQVEKGLSWVARFKGADGWRGYIDDIREILDRSEGYGKRASIRKST